MERCLTRLLVMGHAVPAGSREVTVAFNFISERTVRHYITQTKDIQTVPFKT
jgi:hypothetical protein